MSHEIRTPMNAVLGMLQLARQTDLNERQRDYLDKASSAATSLLGLLNDILDYSKIEAGKLVLEMLPFELEPLMQDLAVVLSGNQGDKDVEVIFDIDPELPSAVVGDRLRLQQILINLAGNALKFTARGHVLVSLRRLAHDAHLVRLRVLVADTGIGISAEQQQRIFEGFTQAEASTSRRFGGTGLGLFICKRLVDLMGGELRVESAPGSGSRFWFDLDLDVAHDQPLRAACPGAGEPLRLLVADDNLVAGELLERTVGALGWRADCVGSGSEAVARVQAAMAEGRRYDVVLMDWRMPDLDGLSAAQLIRQLQGDLPPPMVIMITAYGREVLADARDHSAPPFVDFLTKPVTPKQLADSVLHALHGEQGAPANPPPRPVERTQRLRGVRLLVVEDNALNRQVAAELLSSEGARVALADGGLAGVQQVLEASVPFDAVLMDMQMPDIDGLEATRRIRADGRFAGLPILAMTANASLADREACLAAGMNDHVAKPIDKERLVLCLLGHLGRSGDRGAGNDSGRGRTGRGAGRYRRAFRRQPGADRPGAAALRSGYAGPLRPARTPARRGRCPGQRRDPAYHQGQRVHRWRQRPGRPCQRAGAGPAPRRSAARYGNPRRHPPRRTAHPVRCLPAPPAGDVRRRAGGVGELNPGAVACPAKNSGGPGARLHPLRPVGRITPWALSADTPEARPGLERHPLPVVQCLQASRSRSWALSRA